MGTTDRKIVYHSTRDFSPAPDSKADVAVEGLMAEIRVGIGDQELVAVITRSAAERLRLRPGDAVYAVVKSTEVMIGKG